MQPSGGMPNGLNDEFRPASVSKSSGASDNTTSKSNDSSASQTAGANMSYAKSVKKSVRVEGNARDIRRSTDLSRTYLLDTLPPTGMQHFVKKKFKSMKSFVPSKYKINGPLFRRDPRGKEGEGLISSACS